MTNYIPYSSINSLFLNGYKTVETFDSHGYKLDNDGNVIANKIVPLEQISYDYGVLQQQVSTNNAQNTAGITDYLELQNTLMDASRNLYDYSGNTLYYGNNSYELSGNFLHRTTQPTKEDAIKEDINMIIIQESNMYILASITLATLLVVAIVIASD
jgi:hypothetical protein